MEPSKQSATGNLCNEFTLFPELICMSGCWCLQVHSLFEEACLIFFPLCTAFNATYQSRVFPGASKSWCLLFKWREVATVYISLEKLFLILKWKSIQTPLWCAARSPLKCGFSTIHFSWAFVLWDLGCWNVCTKGSEKATQWQTSATFLKILYLLNQLLKCPTVNRSSGVWGRNAPFCLPYSIPDNMEAK